MQNNEQLANDLAAALSRACSPALRRVVLSAPVEKGDPPRVTLELRGQRYQREWVSRGQAFHENLTYEEACAFIAAQLGNVYRQCHLWDDQYEHSIRVTAKGRVLSNRQRAAQPPPDAPRHNRQKRYLLPEGEIIPPLVDMGVFTQEGRVAAQMGDKYRQINRFVEMVDDEVSKLDVKRLRVVDFGCGKSYLTFVLYHYFTAIRGIEVDMVGLDLKKSVIEQCSRTAEKYGYTGLRFALGDIRDYAAQGPVDIVVSLHACDTATDYALHNAVKWQARLIFSVPCCQHELNAQMKTDALSLLTRYGIIQERTAALMTDSIRANLLEYAGYRAQVLEFVDLSHTPKNLLIRARRADIPQAIRRERLAEVEALMAQFSLTPTLYGLLVGDGDNSR